MAKEMIESIIHSARIAGLDPANLAQDLIKRLSGETAVTDQETQDFGEPAPANRLAGHRALGQRGLTHAAQTLARHRRAHV